MAEETQGPLGESDLVEMTKRLADLTRAEHEIDRAIRAGVDVGDAKAQAAELRQKLTRIKQTYFPGR